MPYAEAPMPDATFKDRCIATAAGFGCVFGIVVATSVLLDAIGGGWGSTTKAVVFVPTALAACIIGERVGDRVLASRRRRTG